MMLPVPVFIVLHYQPLLPIYFGPLLLIIGTLFLGLTRFNYKLEARWGSKYYALSAILRISGIVIISYSWLEILAWDRNSIDFFRGWQEMFLAVSFVSIIILSIARPIVFIIFITFIFSYFLKIWSLAVYSSLFALASFYGLWSIVHLGFRPSLLYRRSDDPLVTTGPYALVRHPQLLSGLAMAFAASWLRGSSWGLLNCVIFAFLYMALVWYEEKELKYCFPSNYFRYSQSVPSLFPTLKRIKSLLKFKPKEFRADEQEQSLYPGPPKERSYIDIMIVAAVIAIAFTIAVPDFLKFQRKYGMSIAKHELWQIHQFQTRYHGIFGTYYVGESEWINIEMPEEANSFYTWFISKDYILPAKYGWWNDKNNPYEITWDMLSEALDKEGRPDLLPYGDKDSFISMIATNTDKDPCLEIWYVNEKEEMFNLVNDREVPCDLISEPAK